MNTEFTAPTKDPAAALNYLMDWSEWLADSEVIEGAEVREETDTLVIDNLEVFGDRVQWRTAGGVQGGNYVVVVQVTTSEGQVDERSIRFRVRNR